MKGMSNQRILALTALFCVVGLFGAAAEPAWVTKSNLNAQPLLQFTARYSPESASSLGIEGFDDAIVDLSKDPYLARTAEAKKLLVEYQKKLSAETDPKVKQDLEIILNDLREAEVGAALNRKYFFPYLDVARFLFGITRQMLDARVPADRQRSLLVRLDKYAGLAPGFRPLTVLAKERMAERLKSNPKLLGPYRGTVEQALTEQSQLVGGLRQLLSKSTLTGWEKAVGALEMQLKDYEAFLRAEVLPKARADHRLPPEVYAHSLKQFGVDIEPEVLIARALTAFAEMRNQMNVLAGDIAKTKKLPDNDYRTVIRALKAEQVATDKVMPLYRERLTQIESLIRSQQVVTLPERKASIRLATEAENAQQPAPHMSPPRLLGNTGEYGEFVLTTGMPPDATGKALRFDDFTHQAGTWTLTAHEARPGHELQFAKMIEAGVSTARAVFAFNSVNVEGWACTPRLKCSSTSQSKASSSRCRCGPCERLGPFSTRWSTWVKFHLTTSSPF